ncbi:MAG TPA: NUMOD4 domain-containing protein, partial [Burkholderiaceae bacterium]
MERKMQEQWFAVPGYVGLYEISALGRIRSLDRYVRGVSKTGT